MQSILLEPSKAFDKLQLALAVEKFKSFECNCNMMNHISNLCATEHDALGF